MATVEYSVLIDLDIIILSTLVEVNFIYMNYDVHIYIWVQI